MCVTCVDRAQSTVLGGDSVDTGADPVHTDRHSVPRAPRPRSDAVLDRVLGALAVAAVHDPSGRSCVRGARLHNLHLLYANRRHHLGQKQTLHTQ